MPSTLNRATTTGTKPGFAVLVSVLVSVASLFLVGGSLAAHAANPPVIPGGATAACAYTDATSTLTWSGAAAGWYRDNLYWNLYVIDPYTETVVNALNHNGGSTTAHGEQPLATASQSAVAPGRWK